MFNRYSDFTVVVKCKHCGQWAAVFTACVYCGAPVDPEEKTPEPNLWMGDISFMGVPGWTQTESGTLIPPPGLPLLTNVSTS